MNLLINDTEWTQEVYSVFVLNMLERADFCGFTEEEIIDYRHLIQSYAVGQDYYSIIEIEVYKPTALLALVYDYYGDIENYNLIEKLNGLKDNDRVSGVLKFVG